MWDERLLRPEPFPSGENHEGWCPGWNPNTQRMELRPPKVVFGPGALDSSTGNIALATDTWTALYTAIPGDGIGMRGGMVGYLPKGRWSIRGQVCIATPSTNKAYRVRVRQGTTEAEPVTQPKIIGGNPITLVGGGATTCPGTANAIFTLPFSVTDIQCNMARDYANEVWVEVYADSTGADPGAALASTGASGNGEISHCTFIKWDGLYGVG